MEKRIDPEYHHTERRVSIDILKKSSTALLALKHVVHFKKNITSDSLNVSRYVGLEDIERNTGQYANTSQKESFGTALRFNINDVLFPKLRPYLNKVHLAQFNGLCSTEFVVMRSKMVSPKFLAAFLSSNLVVTQTKHMMSGNTLPRLQTDDIESLLIPLCDSAKQKEVESIFDIAFKTKLQKEQQAKDLLNSIDDYLLQELGIQLPAPPPNTIENRIFKSSWQKVAGNRFDPSSQAAIGKLISSKFPNIKFSTIISIDPLTKTSHLNWNTKVSFVPMELVSEHGEIKTHKTRQLNENKGYTMFQENDLLWAKITPCMENGKSAIAKNLINKVGFGSTEFFVFRPKEKVDLPFIYHLLHLKFIRTDAKKMFGGSAGHQRVPREYFQRLVLPIPDIESQQRIADKIELMKQKAFLLINEARSGFNQTKKEIERIILE